MTPAMERRVMDEIVNPAIRAMAARGTPFRGVLFAGLMITAAGPKLIEFNARFGDPECEVLVARLASDIVPALLATTEGAGDAALGTVAIDWRPEAALTVVMAAEGYPGKPLTGTVIGGLEEAAASPGVRIFHAGTKAEGGAVLANGGRVLAITALGASVAEARDRAHAAIDRIDWPQGFCRRDIGWQAIARERGEG
jgi:phosphoribosylamine--glycine ligase